MNLVKCPKCGRDLDVTGHAPGSVLTCGVCGNAVPVPPPRGRSRWPYVLLAVTALCLPCLGKSFRNYRTFGIRAKQGECKANLKLWFTWQRVALAEKHSYSTSIAAIGFEPERGNRYAYFSGPGPLEDRSSSKLGGTEQAQGVAVDGWKFPGKEVTFQQLPESVARQLGLSGKCPECDITLACMGQIDADETLDVWTISTAERKDPEGMPIPAGEPFNDVNDVEQ